MRVLSNRSVGVGFVGFSLKCYCSFVEFCRVLLSLFGQLVVARFFEWNDICVVVLRADCCCYWSADSIVLRIEV